MHQISKLNMYQIDKMVKSIHRNEVEFSKLSDVELVITTRFEEYEFNGEKKKTLRLKGMKAVTPVAAEEKPF